MRLPIRVTMAEGESITSLLDRALAASDFTRSDLPALTQARVHWKSLDLFTPINGVRAISHLTDVCYPTVKRASMWRYLRALPVLRSSLVQAEPLYAVARQTWLWTAATQCCPRCLHDHPGVWLLQWHLPWVFHCPRHGIMLLTHCPRCGNVLRECHVCPRRSPRAFGGPWPLAAEVNHPALATPATEVEQDAGVRLLRALDGDPPALFGQPTTSADYLDTVRSLVGLIDHLDERVQGSTRRPFRRTVAAAPRDPGERARLLTAADRLALLDRPQAAHDIASLLEGNRFEGAVRTWVRDHTKRTSALDAVLEEAIGRLSSVGHSRRQAPVPLGTECVPQLFWTESWDALRRAIQGSETTGRAFAALTLAKTITGSTWEQAGRILGLPDDLSTQVARVGKRHLVLADHDFVDLVLSHTPARPADYRERECVAESLLSAPEFVDDVVARLNHRAAMPQLVAERLWRNWCLAHPVLRPGPAPPPTRTARRRLASQRARWTADDDATVIAVLNEWDVAGREPDR